MLNFVKNIFGSSNDRTLKRMGVYVSSINQLESEYSDKPDEFFYSLKEDLTKKFEKNNDIYSVLPEAFAAVREA